MTADIGAPVDAVQLDELGAAATDPLERAAGESVVHRDVKPANEVEKGEPMAVGAEVVHLEEASIVVAKGDTDDAPAIAAEVVRPAPPTKSSGATAIANALRLMELLGSAPAARSRIATTLAPSRHSTTDVAAALAMGTRRSADRI